jgi:UDP-N-acetyl-D-mannosaminuronic acid transferase (WecB/TagA/CpsF family)
LLQEPRRLARRYLVENLPFAFRLFASALYTRMRNHRQPREG